jgi:hypothetical protein
MASSSSKYRPQSRPDAKGYRSHDQTASRNDAYEAALAALREDTRQWWEDVLAHDRDEPAPAG